MADDFFPPLDTPASQSQKDTVKALAVLAALLIAARVSPRAIGPILRVAYGIEVGPAGAVAGTTGLFSLNLAPIPFGVVPAQQYGLRPNYYLPRGLGLPSIVPGASEQNVEDAAHREFLKRVAVRDDVERIEAARRGYPAAQFQQLIAELQSGQNPHGFKDPQAILRYIQPPTPAGVTVAQQPKPQAPSIGPQIPQQRKEERLPQHIEVAGAAGQFAGEVAGFTPRQASALGDALITSAIRQERARVGNTTQIPTPALSAIVGTNLALGFVGIDPHGSQGVSRAVGSAVVTQFFAAQALAEEAARKKTPPPSQVPSISPSGPGGPGGPSIPAVPSPGPLIGSGGTGVAPGSPGNTPGQNRYNDPYVPPSGNTPDNFFAHKHGDP